MKHIFKGGKDWGIPLEENWEFRPSYTDYMYLVLQIFSVGSHCQGIVTSYLPSTPIYITFMSLCNSSCALV